MGQLALLALLDPLAHQVPLAPQEERPMSAGGGQCVQVLLEQSLFTMALLQAVSIARVEELNMSAQQKEMMLNTNLKLQLAMQVIPICMLQNRKP